MVALVIVLLGLLAAGVAAAFALQARRLRRATLLASAHEKFQQRLLANAVHNSDVDPFARVVLDDLRQHTAQTAKLKGLS